MATFLVLVAAFVTAGVAAWFARLSWRESKQTTDFDIAIRLLERCESKDIQEGETRIIWLGSNGRLASYQTWVDWLLANPQTQAEDLRYIETVMSNYELIGHILRTADRHDMTGVVADFLMFRCPQMFTQLRPLTEGQRLTHPLAGADFEWLSSECVAAEQRRTRGAPE